MKDQSYLIKNGMIFKKNRILFKPFRLVKAMMVFFYHRFHLWLLIFKPFGLSVLIKANTLLERKHLKGRKLSKGLLSEKACLTGGPGFNMNSLYARRGEAAGKSEKQCVWGSLKDFYMNSLYVRRGRSLWKKRKNSIRGSLKGFNIDIRYIIMSMLLICLFLQALAQDSTAWKELDRICQAYSGRIAFQANMRLYPIEDSSNTLEDIHASYTLTDSVQDYILGHVEIISTPKYYLTVNHHYKTIFIAGSQTGRDKKDLLDFMKFKKLLQAQNVGVSLDESGKEYSVLITLKDDPKFRNYQVYYSPDTYRIDHVVIQLWDENDPGNEEKIKVLDIRYSDYRVPGNNEKGYSIGKYLEVEGADVVVNKNYQDYKIISQL